MRRIGRALGETLVVVVASLAIGCGSGDDAPAGSEAIDELSGVGDCLAPADEEATRFVQAACDDKRATVRIVDLVTSAGDSPPLCPVGTDVLVDGRQGAVVDGDIAALPETWCLRNLGAPHPGDPGKGGGELIEGDCFAVAGDDTVAEVACDGSGGPAPEHRLLALTARTEDCPVETDEPIELTTSPPRVLCAGALRGGAGGGLGGAGADADADGSD